MRIAEIIKVTGDIRPNGYSDEKVREDLVIISERIETLFGPSVDEYQIDWVDFCKGDNPFGKLRAVEPHAYLFNTETFLKAGIFLKKSFRAHLLKPFSL